jgi:HEAT repeat protein
MNDRQWQEIVAALHDTSDISGAAEAAARLQAEASEDDVPRLLALLSSGDFFIREAAAWPLSDLGRVDAIPALVRAQHQGTDEGHDNDGLNAALADLVSMNSDAPGPVVLGLLESSDLRVRETGQWLLDFCKDA